MKLKTITIVEHIVRQYIVDVDDIDDFDPWDNETFIEELPVDSTTQESYAPEGWEYV